MVPIVFAQANRHCDVSWDHGGTTWFCGLPCGKCHSRSREAGEDRNKSIDNRQCEPTPTKLTAAAKVLNKALNSRKQGHKTEPSHELNARDASEASGLAQEQDFAPGSRRGRAQALHVQASEPAWASFEHPEGVTRQPAEDGDEIRERKRHEVLPIAPQAPQIVVAKNRNELPMRCLAFQIHKMAYSSIFTTYRDVASRRYRP